MISIQHVTKRFGRIIAVDSVSFGIQRGESVALWGSNGAGKTTLIRCMLGVLRFRGSLAIDGLSVLRHGKNTRRLIGYVPQELAFHDDMRLGAAMMFFAKLRGVAPSRCRERLQQAGLTGHERKRVRDLSGGMKQRLALAVAMLSNPPVIVLDEPTSNLDASGRQEVVRMLHQLKKNGKTIVFASHRPDEVLSLADRVIVMEQGKLLRDTTPALLWPGSEGAQLLRLFVSGTSEESAARLLRKAGHTVNLNGNGLCVYVARDKKAEPFRVLAGANIVLRNFEILDTAPSEEDAS